MTKQQILNHFNNGDVVECLMSGIKGIFNSSTLHIRYEFWCFVDKETNHTIIIECNGQLATIIQPDKTAVYAQLGKEVEAILNKETNYAIRGEKISRLYER